MKHKKAILALRVEGKSYDEIQKILGCSKGTIAYHCGTGQKSKSLQRQQTRRKTDPLKQKRERFLAETKNCWVGKNSPIDKAIRNKYYSFHYNTRGNYMFTLEELKEKIGKSPKCYLTGRPIDLAKSRSYHLDHIIPVSRGGDNSLENCNITCREANQAKHNMTVDEFKQLCKEVVTHLN